MPSLRSILSRLDVTPRRSMGQNFLCDETIARELAQALEIETDDTIVEIGPGTGAVTAHLAGRGRRLLLIEKDRRLAAHLRERFQVDSRLDVINSDARDFDLRPLFKCGPVKVLGNLPYSVGTHILLRWLDSPSPVGRAVFMLQKEVCDRILAAPGTRDYGRLTLRVQSGWEPRLLCLVGPEAFHPRPAVQSGVIALTPRPRESLPAFGEEIFRRIVQIGFSQRRKQLKNLLSRLPPSAGGSPREERDLLGLIGASPAARAEDLTLAQWIELARLLDPHPLKDRAQNLDESFDVVDDEDRVIRQASRRDVHELGLKHRAVHVFVFNSRGELFLQKRSHLKDLCAGKWDSSCAGHLDAGEGYPAAAARELAEELGIKSANPLERVARIDACPETGWEFVELYTAVSDDRIGFPAAEIESVAPFRLDEIRAWAAARPHDFAPGFLKCLESFTHFAPGSRATESGHPAN